MPMQNVSALTSEVSAALAVRYRLDTAAIDDIVEQMDAARGMVSHEDFAAGMAAIVGAYTAALGETAATFPPEHQPTAQIVIERAIEVIVARLEQTTQARS